MEPITAADVIARIAGALGIATDRINAIVEHASSQFPDTKERAAYIEAQIKAAVPDAAGVAHSIDGLIADLAARSALVDPNATGGAI